MTNSTLSVTPAPETKRNPNKIPEKVNDRITRTITILNKTFFKFPNKQPTIPSILPNKPISETTKDQSSSVENNKTKVVH